MRALREGGSFGLAINAAVAFLLGNYMGGFAFIALAIYMRIPAGAK